MKVKTKEMSDLYSVIDIYDDITGEKLGEWIEMPLEQLN